MIEGAGLLADMLTEALSRSGKNDVSKVRKRRDAIHPNETL